MEIVTVDIGGTHARFALARIDGGQVTGLEPGVTLKTSDYPSLQAAWRAYAAVRDHPLPRAAVLALACPVTGEVLKLTNNPWTLRPAMIGAELGVDNLMLINDFAAVGHAVAALGPEHLLHLCGPDDDLPRSGVISIVGPGTGLGVALLLQTDREIRVLDSEGAHIDFAPVDAEDEAVLAHLRGRFGRVSVERLASGPGLLNIYQALASRDGVEPVFTDDVSLWQAATDGSDALAVAALSQFCKVLGSVAGDMALVQGAVGLVIAGGVAPRIVETLRASGFAHRFADKGRLEARMKTLPVKLAVHPQLGLLGAAAAFARGRP